MEYHKPIMVQEVLEYLRPERGGIFIDGTLGGGGHAEAVLTCLPERGAHLYGFDRDPDALAAAGKRLHKFSHFTAVHENFFALKDWLAQNGIPGVAGILCDLGVSSYQLDNVERGFSYHTDAPLDMRMDATRGMTAAELLNTAGEMELTRIIRTYGEEKWASRIAQFIIRARQSAPLRTTGELSALIKAAIPASARREGGHPAKRTFQAIRIAVNEELDSLPEAVDALIDCLLPGGRLAVITFHSLEDRIVKHAFRRRENPCTCPPKSPACVCGKTSDAHVLTRKPVIPTEREMSVNSRAQSAKLRALEKLGV